MSISAIKILHARTPDDLEQKINDLLNGSGNWQPCGSPFTLGEQCCIEMINGEQSVNTGGAAPPPTAYPPQIIPSTEGGTLGLQPNGGVWSSYVLSMAGNLTALNIPFSGGALFSDSQGVYITITSQHNVTGVTFSGDAFGGPLANPAGFVAGVMYVWAWDDTNGHWVRLQ